MARYSWRFVALALARIGPIGLIGPMGRRVDGEGVREAAEGRWRGASVLLGTGWSGFGRLGALLVPVLHAGLGHALADARGGRWEIGDGRWGKPPPALHFT